MQIFEQGGVFGGFLPEQFWSLRGVFGGFLLEQFRAHEELYLGVFKARNGKHVSGKKRQF